MYVSNFEVTSFGACMFKTAVPQSTTSAPYLLKRYAIVPPPPASTLPSSPVCQATPALSKMSLTSLKNSAFASLQPPFPPDPVYLATAIPPPNTAVLFFS